MSTHSDQDAFQAYLASIRRYPLLDPEEERALARRVQAQGDKVACHRLVTSNLRFVVHLAGRYRATGFPIMDLVQEGNTGLVRAVHKFDPERQIRLVSYASWWIRAYIHAYLLRSWSLVKLGTTDAQRKLFFSLRKAMRELELAPDDAGDEDTRRQGRRRRLAEKCGVREADVAEMEMRLSGRDVSMHRPADDEDGAALEDVVAYEGPTPEETVSREEITDLLGERLVDVLAALTDRERFVLERRVLSDEPLRLREVGAAFGVTRERARQIENEARGKLRRGFLDLGAAI